ncbi:hypothetical protein Ae201684P_012373 [Aphanomyces euteiches]|nr:hypothetical protein Ae201684P_012373 [Aphanomyces euteiches]
MQSLDRNELAQYFRQKAVTPFVVCNGIDVDVFNEYFGHDDPVVPLRCVELFEGQLRIVEYPISTVHESTVDEFKAELYRSCGDDREFGKRGSMTCCRYGNPDKEADATFGPLHDTPGRTPPPTNREIDDWITLAVEVGRAQDWASLERAALCKTARSMTYRLYDVQDYAHPNQLPPPAATESFRHQVNGPAVNITLDNRRILSIPAATNLPPGVNDMTVIDLRAVMRQVIRSIC